MSHDLFDHLFIEPASLDAALAFYRDVPGRRLLFFWGEPGEPQGASRGSSGMRVMLADIDQRDTELAASDLALFAPEANHWSTRGCVAKDPNGNLMAFEQQTAAA